MDSFKKGIMYSVGCGIALVGVAIGSFSLGAYDVKKSRLIDEAIKGEEVKALALIENKKEPVYKCLVERTYDFLNFGPRLAEKRFKAGKFDETIRKYRSDYHNNS